MMRISVQGLARLVVLVIESIEADFAKQRTRISRLARRLSRARCALAAFLFTQHERPLYEDSCGGTG